MLDLRFLRDNPEVVKQNMRNKFQEHKLGFVDDVIALDADLRSAKQEAENLRAERNANSKKIGALMGQGKKEEAEELKAKVNANSERLAELEKM
jgi:seryl-tRNA synthetase